MTDIVERLRDVAPGYGKLRLEAADEIEWLRAEVHKLSTTCGHCGELERAWVEAERLRAALRNLLSTVDACKTMEVGAGGMTIEAQMKRTVYLRVPMWPFVEAERALGENSHD